jgi:uncharacterized protein YutD
LDKTNTILSKFCKLGRIQGKCKYPYFILKHINKKSKKKKKKKKRKGRGNKDTGSSPGFQHGPVVENLGRGVGPWDCGDWQ